MKILFISKREAKEIEGKIHESWAKFGVPRLNLTKKLEVEEGKWILLGDYLLVMKGEELAPFVGDERLCSFFPYLLVDMGAIKFITNGANVMRPGIKQFPIDFSQGDMVIVKDEKFEKLIAVCAAVMNSEEAQKLEKGIVLRNINYVGDKFWNAYKEYTSSK